MQTLVMVSLNFFFHNTPCRHASFDDTVMMIVVLCFIQGYTLYRGVNDMFLVGHDDYTIFGLQKKCRIFV